MDEIIPQSDAAPGAEAQATSPFPAPPTVFSQPAFRDRSSGLAVYGVIEIILGCFALLLVPLGLAGALFARRSGTALPAGNSILNVLTYGLAAAVLLTLGIGSIRARRWAWAINLTVSWMGLIFGSIVTVGMTVLLPKSFMAAIKAASATNPDAPALPTTAVAVILTFIIAFCAFFTIVVPIAFVVFFRRKDVEQTVKQRDPVQRWTDRCPLPLLAVVLLFFAGAAYLFLMSFTTPIFPMFGRYLIGWRGGICLLVTAVIDAIVAFSLLRLRMAGWWAAVVLVVLRSLAAITTFRRGNLLAAYSKMGWSQEQLRMMNNSTVFHATIYGSIVFGVVFLGYLIWIRRYFVAPVGPTPAASA